MNALWTSDALCDATGGTAARPFDVSGISIDTRTLQPGDLFVALRGENGDGHAHVAAALAAGAAGAMVHDRAGLPGDAPLLVVDDTLAGLTALGRAGRARFTGKAVAVTGSVGKTTVKEMLRLILSAAGPTHAAEASYNNHWGVPLTLARLPQDAAFLISEIGMNHAGEIAPLAVLVRPDVAVIVSVEAAHIGHLGSLDAIADEKAAILTGLEPGGVAVLPADHDLLPRLLAKVGDARVIRFGGDAKAEARILDATGNAETTTITARLGKRMVRFRLPTPGRHMAMNALAAVAVAQALGIEPARSADALKNFRPVAGRGVQQPVLDGQAVLLDESYNASGASVRAALEVLQMLPADRRVAVLGDMLELGEHGPAQHQDLAESVVDAADLLHCCGPLMRHLYDALPVGLRGHWAADAAALAPLVAADLQPGDAVLVKGSYGSKMRLVVAAIVNADTMTRGAA